MNKTKLTKISVICMGILWIAFSYAMAENWSVKISAKGVEIKGMYKSDITIGVQEKESTMEAPPLPPTFSCLMYLPSEDWMSKYNQWIKSDIQTKTSWIIAVNPHGPYGSPMDATSTLSWDPMAFGSGSAVLKKGWSGDGEIVADMKAVSSIDVSGGNLDQYFTIVYDASQ
jgi:hypothetical protein